MRIFQSHKRNVESIISYPFRTIYYIHRTSKDFETFVYFL